MRAQFLPLSLIYYGDGTAFRHNSLYCNNIKKNSNKKERERSWRQKCQPGNGERVSI